MRIVIPGGTGQVGRVLVPALLRRGHQVTVVSRGGAPLPRCNAVKWDGVSQGAWAEAIDGADVVINLASRSVNCRYHKRNLTEMLASRVDSTRAVGRAIAGSARPPGVWLQASTATIYEHTLGPAHDEATGRIGGHERGVPAYWRYSIEIAEAWERELVAAETPNTRRVALRMAIVMSPEPGGTFGLLQRLARLGIGGAVAGGRQYMSWIHDVDLVRAIEWLIEHGEIEGPVNLAAPAPLPQAQFMRELRRAVGMPLGIPAAAWMIEAAACVLGTDSELLLKSRRVVPGRLLESEFAFEFADWTSAARDLVQRARSQLAPRLSGSASPREASR